MIFLTFLAPSITLGVIKSGKLGGQFGEWFRTVLQFVAAFSDQRFEWLVQYWQVIPTVFTGWLIAKTGFRRTSIIATIFIVIVVLCITSFQIYDLKTATANTINSLALKISSVDLDITKSTNLINSLISQIETVHTILIAWLALALGLKAPKQNKRKA
ncbi:MAG: hypothetical protein ACR2O8_14755 [Rhizobiaceae bacterium]